MRAGGIVGESGSKFPGIAFIPEFRLGPLQAGHPWMACLKQAMTEFG